MILNNANSKVSIGDGVFEVVHEVKNSIAVCKGYLDIIDLNEKGDMKRYLSVIRSEIDRSADMIGDFMLYKKIVKEFMDMDVLLNDLCEEMEIFIEGRGILFEYDILDEESYIYGDYNKLKQVFINLIKNSIEAIDDSGGKIKLISYVIGDYYYVLLEDNGCGMEEEVLKRIKDESFTTKENGNGIGVGFSRRIIEYHDGVIKYTSKHGVGTKVIVKLPKIMI